MQNLLALLTLRGPRRAVPSAARLEGTRAGPSGAGRQRLGRVPLESNSRGSYHHHASLLKLSTKQVSVSGLGRPCLLLCRVPLV
jgi:hypothetical protein